jgi:hypothetical protein
MQFVPPVESMRPGALPADYRHRGHDPNERLRDLISDADGWDADVVYPVVRACSCGSEVLRGSHADTSHRRECGEPDETGEPERAPAVKLPVCAGPGCSDTANFGATYCSAQCRAKARG